MSEFKRVSTADAFNHLQQGAIFVDIRDLNSYQQAHIPNATHLDNQGIHDFLANAELEDTIIIYCYHGHSSLAAAHFFADQGFSNVYSMDGGFTAWQQDYPSVCDDTVEE
ncbi:thiosulfate sulfurtransferase GlpE [Spartinivicinus poritis]|uniref:Thiosulfate sulfurtransferase GlpE n=1 Tax=Spartinivicinus poritis TaxID=2994640 RepID=A0ABT5UA23_9GAMM|nr:thiosulfate sulfurtransferase GlpE [Spartinivicinus sp. A2-2]MDE1463223.1 thiosulfate sulfurtransferase GlpE [Spartinivicinus sp. A2-2]